MSGIEHSHTLKGKRARGGETPPATRPQVPKRARIYLSLGTFAGLFCAEAMSSMRLYSLGEHAGYPPFLAWLLPGALDVYALTLVWFFSLLPAEHPLRRKAAREAALALGITVLCNALDEIVEAFASQLPYWAPRVLFVFISALAPFVAYRLIHFRAEIGNDTERTDSAPHADTDTRSAARTVTRKPTDTVRVPDSDTGKTPKRQGDGGNVNANDETVNDSLGGNGTGNANPAAPTGNANSGNTDNANSKGRTDDEWIAIAKDVYVNERDQLGKRPPEKAFWTALVAEVDRLIEAGEIPAADAPSLGTAKRVRGLVEAAFPELAPRIHLVAS